MPGTNISMDLMRVSNALDSGQRASSLEEVRANHNSMVSFGHDESRSSRLNDLGIEDLHQKRDELLDESIQKMSSGDHHQRVGDDKNNQMTNES